MGMSMLGFLWGIKFVQKKWPKTLFLKVRLDNVCWHPPSFPGGPQTDAHA